MTEQFHPNANYFGNDGIFSIYSEGDNRRQELANIFLILIRSRKRFRKIVFEDRVVEVVYATPEQAMRCAEDLQFGEDGNLFLPTTEA